MLKYQLPLDNQKQISDVLIQLTCLYYGQ